MKVTCFSTKEFERKSLVKANNGNHDLLMVPDTLSLSTASIAQRCEGIMIFTGDDASAPVIEKLHSIGVKYIALRSAGYDNVNLQKAHELGIKVANVPSYSPYAIAEHSILLMLALNRKIISTSARIHLKNFSLNGLVGFDMNGKTAGIIGTGNIGSVAVKILHGLGCRILAYDINQNKELTTSYGVKYTSLDELLKQSDIISIYTPLTQATKRLINKESIDKMKNGVMLINTSRGGIVDTSAVIEALKNGKIASAGLDVYENEKGIFFFDRSNEVLQDDLLSRLMAFNNVIITPHQAFLTNEALENIADTSFQNLTTWSLGNKSKNEL